jgi:hypothetical protein
MLHNATRYATLCNMDIGPFPTDPPGEMTLRYRAGHGRDTVLVERRFYDPPQKVVLFVPVEKLWALLVNNAPDFRFEGLSLDEIRDGIDFARQGGWRG